jgi:hypothetical protein
VGVILLGLYAVAVVATLPLGHGIRPLFEGIGPPPAYRWVKPPPAFAANNVPPRPNESDVALGPQGSEQAGVLSEDSQLVLNLPVHAIAPHPPDTSVKVRVVPLDPATLSPLPEGLGVNGNAYQVKLTYQPSGQDVATLATPGNILLTVPLTTAGLWFSLDSRAWQRVGNQTVPGQPVVGGPFAQPGYYSAGTHLTPATKPGGGSSHVTGIVIAVVLTAALALALGFGPALRRRLRGH